MGMDPARIELLRKSLELHGLQCCMLTCYPDFTHPDRLERTRQLEETQSAFQIASRIGARFVRLTAGQSHPGVTHKQGLSWAVEGLSRSAQMADELGLQVVFENHTRAYPWKNDDFAMHSAVFLEILHRLESTSVMVNFDTANTIVANEDPLTLLESVVDKVVCVHAFDVKAPGSLQPVIVGTGAAPILEIFTILKKNKFDGWICVEEASRMGRSGFEQSVSNVRRTWKNSWQV